MLVPKSKVTLQELLRHCKGIWEVDEISNYVCQQFEILVLCFKAHDPVMNQTTKPKGINSFP